MTELGTQPPTAERHRVAWGAWTRLIVASVARVVVLSILGGLFWAMAPSAIGWRPTTVMSDSMAPVFRTGDVAVSMPATPDVETIGSILLVDDPDHPGRLRLHRMYDVTPEGEIVTKGDANAQPDSSHVTQDEVRGVAVLRVPFVGLPLVWARYHDWGYLAAAAAAFLGLVLLAGLDADLRRAGGPDVPETRRARRRRLWRDRVVPPVLIVGSAGVAALVLALTTGAHAAFAATTANPTSAWTGAADFACWPTSTAADSPYFSYRFDTTASPTVDASGNGRTGALGTGTASAPGVCPAAGASPARTFDGSATALVAPAMGAISGPNTFSLEAWIKTTATGGRIIGFGNSATGLSSSYDRHLYIGSDGRVVFGVYPNAVRTVQSVNPVNDGAWHHVVATMSTVGGMRLYVDGALVASNTLVLSAQSYSGYWRVGYDNISGWTATSGNGYVGTIDNAAVYTSALTAAQVSAHYATGH